MRKRSGRSLGQRRAVRLSPVDIWVLAYRHLDLIIMVIILYILFYTCFGWFSKPYFKELTLQRVGDWRTSRRAGYIVWVNNGDEFYNVRTKIRNFIAFIYNKRSFFPKWYALWICRVWAKKGYTTSQCKKILIDRKDVKAVGSNEVVVDKKCMMWDTEKNRYELTDKMPITYAIEPSYLERWILKEIENIDTKATKAARASPGVVHMNLSKRSIPIPSESYAPIERDVVGIDIEHIITKRGEYKRQIDEIGQEGVVEKQEMVMEEVDEPDG